MRLASFRREGRSRFGLVTRTGIVDLADRLPGASSLRELCALGVESAARYVDDPADVDIGSVVWEPVVPDPEQILCIGLNYRAHAAEVGRPPSERPAVFLRTRQSQTAHLGPLIRPRASEEFDYEGELAVIVGAPGRRIDRADAFDHIAGYALYNDASARDWQRHSHQYTPGKNFPSTGALGPWLTTADEVPDPREIRISTRVNGVLVQESGIDDLIFTIPEIIEYLSMFTELRPGDVIPTGTPSGVGSMRVPPLWLRPGDVVEVEGTGLGTLVNPVVEEAF